MENEHQIDCDIMLSEMSYHNSKFITARVKNMPMEDQLLLARNSPMHSFWHEMKEMMERASEEIKQLKQRIKELESNNVKVS